MNNQTVATFWVLSLAFSGLYGAFGGNDDNVYAVIGIFMFIFGIWGAIRLYKSN